MPFDGLNELLASLKQQPNRISEVEALVEQCIDSFDLREARALATQLDSALAGLPQGLVPQVRGLAARLKILALPLYLNRNELLTPFKVGLGKALSYETPDIIQRVKAALLNFWIDDRDQWRQDMVTAMHQNQDILTAASIPAPSGERRGTVANWLTDYDSRFGTDLVDSIKVVEYLYHSDTTKRLAPGDRELLARLFKIYEYLKLSSTSALGVEEELDFEEGGIIKDFNNGHPRPILDLRFRSGASSYSSEPSLRVVGSTVGNSLVLGKPFSRELPVTHEPVVAKPRPSVAPTIVGTAKVQPIAPPVATTIASIPHVPSALTSPSPAFLFDLSDEREADAFRIKNQGSRTGGTLEQELREFADRVIKRHNFSFKDELNKRRFVALFVSRLKDVRSVVDAREALLKPVASGGLGLATDKVEQVLKIIEDAKKDFAAKGKVPAAEPGVKNVGTPATSPTPAASAGASALDRLIESDISAFLVKPTPGEKKTDTAKQAIPTSPAVVATPKLEVAAPKVTIERAFILPATPEPVPPKPPAVPSSTPTASPTPEKISTPPGGFSPDKVQEWRKEMLKELARAASPVPAPAAPTSSGARFPVLEPMTLPPRPAGRPQLSDVKAPPRTVGPVGELRSLGLTDFRRLGPVLQALDRVLAKVELIGETSITKRLEAVRAWQASLVYQQYLKLGRESIEQGKTVAEVTAELAARGEETLSEAEFNAIADFNTKIRF